MSGDWYPDPKLHPTQFIQAVVDNTGEEEMVDLTRQITDHVTEICKDNDWDPAVGIAALMVATEVINDSHEQAKVTVDVDSLDDVNLGN